MADHHDEMEQLEALKRWWLENRAFVIAGVVIGVVAVGGWRGYEWYRAKQAEEGSVLFTKVQDAVAASDATGYDDAMAKLVAGYASTPYAANAALLVAKAAVDSGDLAKAEAQLAWVIAQAKDAEIKALAQVRLARVQLAQGQAEPALATLVAIGADGAFAAAASEARGDALRALGRNEEARAAYRAALAASEDNRGDKALIELKLADLGPEVPVAAPATAPTAAAPTGAKP
jgi:predicted negative regulator of RcsB-dependent stress response